MPDGFKLAPKSRLDTDLKAKQKVYILLLIVLQKRIFF